MITDTQQPLLISNTLTAREIEILKFLAQGYTSKRISEACEISVLTVQTHRRNMLKKMQLLNSHQLIGHAYREGVLQ
ncbi:response regulator transcription factor [Filimonas effusa]|uniref:LuxR family transcriptional regulator n=1 Tax=Filimonas effusa TaxID=2508721 RepID=A0A4Q1D7N0_9BACT|nr:helix-turn-helix transcriptional regulator [Filimonas effusa]RXK85282.1 LuxR family transcriptional regulator [Filimonas effusa]